MSFDIVYLGVGSRERSTGKGGGTAGGIVIVGGIVTGGTVTGGIVTGGTVTGGTVTGGTVTGGIVTGGAVTGGVVTGVGGVILGAGSAPAMGIGLVPVTIDGSSTGVLTGELGPTTGLTKLSGWDISVGVFCTGIAALLSSSFLTVLVIVATGASGGGADGAAAGGAGGAGTAGGAAPGLSCLKLCPLT